MRFSAASSLVIRPASNSSLSLDSLALILPSGAGGLVLDLGLTFLGVFGYEESSINTSAKCLW